MVGRGLVDGGAGEPLLGGVAAVLQLVVARVEGERLHHVGPGAQELAVQLQNWFQSHRSVSVQRDLLKVFYTVVDHSFIWVL